MNQPAQPPPPANRLTRFTDRVGDYVRSRPTYPSGAIDAVMAGLGDPPRLRVLDVGAGTGISSRLLAARGCGVVALEPNDAMRAAGSAAGTPGITWIGGTGEATGQRGAAFDVVTCFQAFHWLRHDEALIEFARVLKPGGRAALVWNVRDESDPCTRAYGRTIIAHATEPPTSPALSAHGLIPETFRLGWRGYRMNSFPTEQSLDRAGLHGRALSASYSPNAGAALEALRRDLDSLFDTFASDQRVTLRYSCEVHLAEAPRGE
ncbi:MAG: class I SAM-dependent methyltransferase [Phycisphaerae bacterium]|nr:class I SAM-dependent methyltransferase [Phycisphaerae bacterium]